MKRFLVTLISALAIVLSMASCEKETPETLTCEFFDSDMYDFRWSFTDRIKVFGSAGQGIYAPQSITDGGTTAEFALQSGEPGTLPFQAFYPASITDDGVTITFPAQQYTIDGSLKEIPMYAHSNRGSILSFNSLCWVLKLHLQKSDIKISSISVTAEHVLCGDFTLQDGEVVYSRGGSNTVTMVCSQPQSIDNGADFCFYFPPMRTEKLDFRIVTDDGRVATIEYSTGNLASHLQAGNLFELEIEEYALTFDEGQNAPEGAVDGIFSVGPTKRVFFSKGNLQYNKTSSEFRFAEHQYDTLPIEYSNRPLADSITLFDGFEWGTGADPTHASTSEADYITDFVDWGINPISNGGNQANLWRTLTLPEWLYLLNGREGANDKYGMANIGNALMLILLPDSWEPPLGCVFISGSWSVDEILNNQPRNYYSIQQWSQMEENGAVAIPIIYIKKYYGGEGSAGEVWFHGLVWTNFGTYVNGDYAPLIIPPFSGYDLYESAEKSVRMPVRLVADVH